MKSQSMQSQYSELRRALRQFRTVLLVLCLVATQLATLGGDSVRAQDAREPESPRIAPASAEGQAALRAIRVAPGLKGSLFAAEPLVANPVAIFVDLRGRVFVCESFRQNRGVTDNRDHDDAWLDADLAAQTVEDRRGYHLKQLGDDAPGYTEQDDRIRLLLDVDQDGVADESHVFADRFNALVEGTGAAVLEHRGQVYYTNIPNLWRMRDSDGDHAADAREILHTGYGVRVAYRGHDLHGLRLGPDGRLYFSIGDRGANVETPGGRLKNTESGSIFRCELDGSNLEIYATGLRNPQDLAFDDFGNLFTGDNNSDSGDRARWVFVVEGGDSGWRMAYQYLRDRGPFNRERLWHPHHEGQPAYIVPPVANISDGPAGVDYYPGTGFPEEFRGRFFLSDFRGTASSSGIRSFRVEADGASFKLVDDEQPIWGVLTTDVQFGPDGSLYVCDWVESWEGVGKGRIYRYVSEAHTEDPIVAEVRTLLAGSFADKDPDRLLGLLAHADQRVRQKAQFELAARKAAEGLTRVASAGGELLARLHAIWALDQIARSDPSHRSVLRELLLKLLDDRQVEMRAHAARLLGEISGDGSAVSLRRRLADESARVRYFAAVSLGKLRAADAMDDVVRLLEENNNHDPILRHGGIMALAGIGTDASLGGLVSHDSVAVRLAAAVALRRRESPAVAVFLDDTDSSVMLEAARAIHDVPIPSALPALAALIDRETAEDALARRVLNAAFRLGTAEQANALAEYASRDDAPVPMRLEAIEMLGSWSHPSSRDRVLGMWRPLEPREDGVARDALRPLVGRMISSDSEVRLAVARVAGDLGLPEAVPILSTLLDDAAVQANQRADALRTLVKLSGEEGLPAMRRAVTDDSVIVRAAGLELLPRFDSTGAMPLLEKAALEGEVLERQAAITSLGGFGIARADDVLANLMKQLLDGTLPPTVHLEVLTAASRRDTTELRRQVAEYRSSLDPSRPADEYRETLHGGDARRGRLIFRERISVSCIRCHNVFFGGGEVGPDLTRIAADKDREYLLESLVDPNKTIAKGFESLIVVDLDGRTYVGVLKEETAAQITLMDANGRSIIIPQDEVEIRKPSQSAMPADVVKQLNKSEIRDLVEYLASLDGRRRFRGFNRRRPGADGPTVPLGPPHVAAPRARSYPWMSLEEWRNRHQRNLARKRAGPINLLFLGDSITEGWGRNSVWRQHYQEQQSANFGIGGDTTQHLLWRITEGRELEGISPKVAVVMIGTNNIGRPNGQPADIAGGITKIVQTIRQKLPDARILLLGVFPRGRTADDPVRDQVRQINERIATLDDGQHVRYLDITGDLLADDGSLARENSRDALHLTEAGYRQWAAAMNPLLFEMLDD